VNPPIVHIYDLNRLPVAGADVVVAAGADELIQLARWAEVDAVTRFEGRVALRKLSQTRFVYDAELSADIVQSCVVTLEPVRSRVARRFVRTLLLISGVDRGETVTLALGDDDSPDEIENPRYDLAIPLLEEFALAIDPYPRVPDVAFEVPGPGAAGEESPFAVLKKLKPGA
jgi:uncharacterized metal-binding protein YceD (DUF177 family)